MKRARPKKLTEAQLLLGFHLEELGFREITYEYQFNMDRKWRADVYTTGTQIWRGQMLFECDGGKFRGGHRRGLALEADYERQNWAIANGFAIYRFTNEQVLTGKAKAWIQENLL
jgi:very-short-patch-repair endonuclease